MKDTIYIQIMSCWFSWTFEQCPRPYTIQFGVRHPAWAWHGHPGIVYLAKKVDKIRSFSADLWDICSNQYYSKLIPPLTLIYLLILITRYEHLINWLLKSIWLSLDQIIPKCAVSFVVIISPGDPYFSRPSCSDERPQ